MTRIGRSPLDVVEAAGAGSGNGHAGPLLEVRDLGVAFSQHGRWVQVVSDVSLSLRRGETVGLVGESGSGKTVTALAIMGLIAATGGRMTAGSVELGGSELIGSSERRWRDVRGKRIAMIFQQPTRSLNPAFTVGAQIAEAARLHLGLDRRKAWARAVEALDGVGIANAEKRAREYPHTFSGGMCQRAMIAMALVGEPEVLIADEPTTALDVTVQARVLELLREIQRETQVGMLFVTHDLGVIAQMCDRVNVFYAGQVVEATTRDAMLRSPRHPYTAGLLGSVPQPGKGRRLVAIPGTTPDFEHLPDGCRFHPRCSYAEGGRCDAEALSLTPTPSGAVRCVRVDELKLEGVAGA
jgi:peptide/nickel transport system ATP-binding protein/oligopeptide transport system ATP-binding protein